MITKAMHALIGKICLKMSCSVRNGALDLLCILEFTGKAGCSGSRSKLQSTEKVN